MVPYGGFWWRVLAYIIDAIVMNIIFSIGGAALGVGMLPLSGIDNGGAILGAVVGVSMLGSLVLSWLYFALMESSKLQATLGKLAVGLVVTDLHGERIGFLRATGRYFAQLVSAFIFFIGFIMVAFTERKQGLHDMMAGTLVFKTRDPREVQSHESVFA